MQEKMSSQVGVVSGLNKISDTNLMPPPDSRPTQMNAQSDQFLRQQVSQEEPTS
jgi:hypothetical protein